MAAPQENNQPATPPAPPLPLPPQRAQPLMAQLPRRLEHEISRMDSCIRELEDESRHGSDEGYGSLIIRRRILKIKAMRAKLISRYLQHQQKHEDGGDAPPPPPAAGGAAAVN